MLTSHIQSLTGPCTCSLSAPSRRQWRQPVSRAQHHGSSHDLSSIRQRGAACSSVTMSAWPQQSQQFSRRPSARRRARRGGALVTRAGLQETLVGLGIFFTPSIVAVIYAYFKGKGNVKDGLSRMLTVRLTTLSAQGCSLNESAYMALRLRRHLLLWEIRAGYLMLLSCGLRDF